MEGLDGGACSMEAGGGGGRGLDKGDWMDGGAWMEGRWMEEG